MRFSSTSPVSKGVLQMALMMAPHQLLALVTLVLVAFTVSSEAAVSDVYSQMPGGQLPSPVRYFQASGDQTAEASEVAATSLLQGNSIAATNSERPQQPRLGYPLYTGNSGYASTGSGTGVYSPVKLDLGGLLLGTVVGLGAVLLIPKLLHIFSYGNNGYSSYGRNEESMTAELSQMISRVDEALAEQNINASSCLQRVMCSFSQPSSEPSTFSSFLTTAVRNPLVGFLMEGSRLQMAVDAGRSNHSCAAAFPQCPFNQDSIAKAFSNSLQT